MYALKKISYVYILNIFIYNINYININIYMEIFSKYILYVCIYIDDNKSTQYTHLYYANKDFYFWMRLIATNRLTEVLLINYILWTSCKSNIYSLILVNYSQNKPYCFQMLTLLEK